MTRRVQPVVHLVGSAALPDAETVFRRLGYGQDPEQNLFPSDAKLLDLFLSGEIKIVYH